MTSTDGIDRLTWDTLRLDDADELCALLNDAAEADGTGERLTPELVREFLSTPGSDLARDTIAVRDSGRLVAEGSVDVAEEPDREGRTRCRLQGTVHPDHRRRGIGSRILDRQQEIAAVRAEAEHPGRPGHLHVGGGLEGAAVRPLLEARGYERVRSFLEMLRPLPGDPIVPTEPIGGIELIAPTADMGEAVRSAHVAAFADHWGSAPVTAERWAQSWSSSTRRLELSTIAVDEGARAGERRVLAYVMTDVWEERRLYIALVGTRPEARGQGIGTAVLSRTLRLAAETGEFDDVQLEVDGESLTGATRLYERLGFVLDKDFALFSKDL